MNALVSYQPSVLWVLEQKVGKAWAGVRSPLNTKMWTPFYGIRMRSTHTTNVIKTRINTISTCGMWTPSYPERSTHTKLGGNECRQAVSQKYIFAQDTRRVEKIQCNVQPVPYMICTCPPCWLSNESAPSTQPRKVIANMRINMYERAIGVLGSKLPI